MSEKTPEDKFDPISDVKAFVTAQYQSGKLPLILLGSSVLFNLFFFSFPTGFELYGFVPIAGFVGALLGQYWDQQEHHRRMVMSSGSLIFASAFDGIVSISFIIGPNGIDFLSVPTLIADILCILSFIGWYRGWKIPAGHLVTKSSDE